VVFQIAVLNSDLTSQVKREEICISSSTQILSLSLKLIIYIVLSVRMSAFQASRSGGAPMRNQAERSIDTSAGLIPPMLYEATIPCRVNFSSEIRENYQLP